MSSDRPLPSPEDRDPTRPMPGSRTVPSIDPSAPLDPGLQLSPEELAAQAAKPPPPPSRRFVLGSLGFAALAAGAGVGYSFWRTRHPAHRPPPAALVAAAHDERALVAYLDTVLRNDSEARVVLQQLRLDHAAHATALEAALRAYSPSSAHSASAMTAAPDLAGVRSTERAAAQAASRRAAQLQGEHAALLASIAACESTHLELLR